MQTHYEEMTDKELRKLLKTWGWMLKKDGDQYEVYPKGERGSWSYFTTDKMDALGTAAAESRAMFNNNLRHITNDEVKGALLLWFSTLQETMGATTPKMYPLSCNVYVIPMDMTP
jgi:hypothetical protein